MAWYETKKGGTARISENTATGEIATFTTLLGGLPMKSVVCSIVASQSGTGDPSPSNVRPISGFTGLNLYRTGSNVWDEEWELGDIDSNTGAPIPSNNVIRTKNFISIKPDTQYFAYVTGTGTSTFRTRFYDRDKNYIGANQKSGSPVGYNSVFISPVNAYYMKFTPQTAYGTTYQNDISINYPATDRNYHPYTGTVIPITWQTTAGTVYGGELDVTSGVLTVTHGEYTFTGLESWFGNSPQTYWGVTLPIDNALCDAESTTHYTSNGIKLRITTNGKTFRAYFSDNTGYIDSSTDMNTLFASGIQLVYPLATPQTFQLTAEEVVALLNTNNIWHDAGGNTTVEYYDGTVVNLDDVMDSYELARRPDVPSLISGNTAFDYSDLKSSSTTIPQNMFNGCTNVNNVESPYVTTVGASAFEGATKLKYISLPNCTQVQGNAFACGRTGSTDQGFVMINLPKCTQFGNSAFNGFGADDNTAELEFPEVTTMGSSVFAASSNTTRMVVKSIKLPKLQTTGSTAFQRVVATTIDIGENCTQLNTTPLANATVTNFICRATTPPALGSSAGLGGSNMTLTNIYVPDASLNDYKDTTNYPRWAQHSALMHPLSEYVPS